MVAATAALMVCADGCIPPKQWTLWPTHPAGGLPQARVESAGAAQVAPPPISRPAPNNNFSNNNFSNTSFPNNNPPNNNPPSHNGVQTASGNYTAPAFVNPPSGYGWPEVTPRSFAAPMGPVSPDEFEPARIVARVGNEVILAGDILGPIDQALAPYEGKVPKEQIDQQRQMLLRAQIPVAAESKMLYLAYLREVPAEKLNEAMPKIWAQVHARYDEDELPKMLEKYKVDTARELDAKLREFGWSLAKQRRMYGERNLGMAGAFQNIDRNPEITHDEMLAYFDEHAADYAVIAKARWEQLMVRFDKFASRPEAYNAIVAMGNEVVLGGAPLWAVAKRSSHGFNADQGGQHDWTNQGSLASTTLDRAIFELPIGQLSQILEDEQGFHIVRVIERRGAGRTPFTEAQVEIKQKLQEEKRKQALQKYITRLKREIPIWTAYDDEPAEVATSPDNAPNGNR